VTEAVGVVALNVFARCLEARHAAAAATWAGAGAVVDSYMRCMIMTGMSIALWRGAHSRENPRRSP
jgi:hypothetical protein